jgi:hypothetical protein
MRIEVTLLNVHTPLHCFRLSATSTDKYSEMFCYAYKTSKFRMFEIETQSINRYKKKRQADEDGN